MTLPSSKDFPTVTQVLDPFIDKEWFKPEHQKRGTAVHDAVKCHLLGLWSVPLPEEYQGYYESGLRWIDENVDKIIMVEQRLVDYNYKYTGRPDLFATIRKNPEVGIADWKTSVALDRKRWSGQSAGYYNLGRVNEYDIEWACSVRLRSDGKMAMADFVKNLPLELQYFLNALTAYKRYA